MPRFVVERRFPDGLDVPINAAGAELCLGVSDNNAVEGVTWIHSYVTTDKRTSFCIYDGPDAEAIRRVADVNGLPVERISPVRILDPYFYM